MPEYLAPGVYVEETSFRSKAIEGVSTATTGFVGPCRYGPVIEPAEEITSLVEFERTYAGGAMLEFAKAGGPADATTPIDNFLWHAVRAFFTEGGKRLYVARVFRPLAGEYPLPPGQSATPVGTTEKPLWSDGHGRHALPGAEFRSRFPGKASNLIVRLTASIGADILASAFAPEIDPPNGGRDDADKPTAGIVKEGDVVLIAQASSSRTGGHLRIANYDALANKWRFRDSDNPTLEELGLVVDPIPGAGDSMHVLTVSVSVHSDDRKHDLGTWTGLSLDPKSDQSLFGRFRAQPASISEARSLPLVIDGSSASDALTVLRTMFPDLLKVGDEERTRFGEEGTLVRKLAAGVVVEFALTGGNDGLRPGASEYAGTADEANTFKTGLKQFRDVEEISIVAAPGSTADYASYQDDANAIYRELIAHAEFMRYCIAVLDCPPQQGVADVRQVRAGLDSKYAAFYYPWVTILDPVTGKELNLPPSGFVAGIFARNDAERGVHKAPANEVVNLAIGLETLLNKAQQEVLNPEGINCFRFFEGRGFRLWGARTISADPEWKYVNLRRYFAYLERSIDKGTQWAIFESNGPALWANVRRTIEDFLFKEFQKGALFGNKPEQAYFVKCDRSTMTQDDLDNGRLIALIGVAALRPAEFVIFRIGQWTADRRC